MSLRAIDLATQKLPRPKIEVFGGSLLEGIEVKATLRAFSRGREEIYVKETGPSQWDAEEHQFDGFPVVWLLNPQKSVELDCHEP